jgi:hypothetical protein
LPDGADGTSIDAIAPRKDNNCILSDQEIKNIIKAQRGIFVTKEDMERFPEEMRKSFSDLLTSVDAYTKRQIHTFQEMVALNHKVDKHEKRIQQLAEREVIY